MNDISINYNNNYIIKSDFNTKDVLIYETNSDESLNYDNSFDNYNKTIDEFDINDYENKIKTLSSENSKLNQQLIGLEEQIMDLISDKQCLEKSTKIRINSFRQKIDTNVSTIEELKQNVLNLESINFEFREKVNQKTKEMEKMRINLEEIKDKVRNILIKIQTEVYPTKYNCLL